MQEILRHRIRIEVSDNLLLLYEYLNSLERGLFESRISVTFLNHIL